jgi:isoamylase
LLDPYAKAIDGQIDSDPSLYSYDFNDPTKLNEDDSLGHTMLSVVINPFFDWGHDRPPHHEYHNTIIYEAHVKGLTMVHPDVPESIRGTYAAIGHQAIIDHLVGLGVTAIELMPVNDFPGRHNWGYDGVLPYAPDSAYGSPDDLKELIDAAHGLDLMMFLDVVYNHFGPDGNYLHAYAPQFFRDDVSTPWGPAIDFRRPEVRD